jgi:hypothetical protein
MNFEGSSRKRKDVDKNEAGRRTKLMRQFLWQIRGSPDVSALRIRTDYSSGQSTKTSELFHDRASATSVRTSKRATTNKRWTVFCFLPQHVQ